MTLAQYSFMPWLRRGIANAVSAPAAGARASIDVALKAASESASSPIPSRRVALVGPGDIVGVHPGVVVRTEPRAWVTNFESNYLVYVEFYDEDFPWRYTPAPPDTALHRLTPWITLLVLKEAEFERKASPAQPLPSVALRNVAAAAVLPQDTQLYAWAHVHVNATLGTTRTPDLAVLDATLEANPDAGYSRLLSPRRLEPNTGYYGFVIPTFEVGRKAGLGQAVADTDSGLAIAWSTAAEFPVYWEWYFRTGAAGDFESMVRALKPRPIDKRVGMRDLDVQQPGFMMPPITSPPDDVVGLEGAILSPTSEPKPLAASSNFGPAIEGIVNLAADVEQGGVAADGGDPVVTAPLYGRWHALVQRISADPAHANWVNALNDDPRYRAAAGFGTRVIQKNQESYMQRAWAQIGDVLAANRRVQAVQLAMQSSQRLHERTFTALADERALAIAAPVLAKVKGSPVTLRAMVDRSALPRSALSGAFRKALRPRGLLARRMFTATPLAAPSGAASRLGQAIAALNAGQISAAPPRALPPGMTLERIADVLAQTPEGRGNADALQPKALSVGAVKAVPPRPVFDMPPRLHPVEAAHDTSARVVDSPVARAFRGALVAFHELLSTRSPPVEPRAPLALSQARGTVQTAIEPVRAFPARISPLLRIGGVALSDYVRDRYHDRPPGASTPPRIATVMAYPDIRDAMYAPLAAQSSELLVPNLKLVAPNTISLMVKNQPFIEAYMAGLNHEFARELLWREYPTDQRPSTFRQFWDVSHVANVANADPVAFEESLRDVTPLHEWSATSNLGDHDNRRGPGDPPETADTPLSKRAVILVVRGDLLKRYPNTVIYAQRATWGTRADNALRLTLWDETGEKSDTADPNIRYPQYRAFVEPDLHFVGFDLSVEEVRGDPALVETAEAKAQIPADKLGWFFVLKEVVGEPRFGLDENPPDAPGPIVWDNLSWANLGADVTVIDLAKPFAIEPGGTDRENVAWGASAADMAFILYQKPVLVAVHARDMLRELAS